MDAAQLNDPLNLRRFESLPRIESNHILFLGDCYAAGMVVDEDRAYAHVMAESLALKERRHGYLNNYEMFDLLGQVDLEPGASVILQFTELGRLCIYNKHTNTFENRILEQLGSASHNEVYTDEILISEVLRHLTMFVKYARERKIRLVIWSIMRFRDQHLNDVFEDYLNQYPEYVYIDGVQHYQVDLGYDNMHPGPGSHAIIARMLLEHYRKLYA
jgi:hypothetical protein